MTKIEQSANKTSANSENQIPEILKNPALLNKIKLDLDNFIVGEDENKLLLYLICSTSHGETPLGAIITGSSSSGKSFLMNQVSKGFSSNVIDYTRITSASLDRLKQNMKGKIFKVEELHGIESVQAKLRILISEGGLKLLTTTRNEQGKIETEVIETIGTPVFLTTTTSYQIDEELTNRLFIISIDESPEQTRRILRFQSKYWDGSQGLEAKNLDTSLFKHLILTKVVIPYYDLLAEAFPVESVKSRRDFQKLCYLIKAVAFLYQHQRLIVTKQNCKIPQYIVSFPSDFYMAWAICEEGMKQTLMNVQKRALDVLARFKKDEFKTVVQVANELGISQSWARQSLLSLVQSGFLTVDKEHRTHMYWLKENPFKISFSEKEVSVRSFDEKKLKNWLEQHFFNAVGEQTLTSSIQSYIHPITGESFGFLSESALQKHCFKPNSTFNSLEKPLKTSFSGKEVSVPLSTEFTLDIQNFYETRTVQEIEAMIQNIGKSSEDLNKALSPLAQIGLALKDSEAKS